MSTGKRWCALALSGSIVACQPAAPGPQSAVAPTAAWWVMPPERLPDRSVDRAVLAMRPDWQSTVATDAAFWAEQSSEARADIAATDARFAISATPLGTTIERRFRVGVYVDRDRSRGRYLAVERGGRIEQLFAEAADAPFSALRLVDDKLLWFKCLDCDDFDTLIVTDGGISLM